MIKSVKIKEVYGNSVLLESEDGNRLVICIHNNEWQLNVLPKNTHDNKWYKANMLNQTIKLSEWNKQMPSLSDFIALIKKDNNE